jgi:CBS-domain-containing membrane protein
MSEPALTCSPSDSIEDAQTLMRSHQIRRLPVVDEDQRLIGILSLNDLAVAAPDPENRKRGVQPAAVADTLSAISEHRHGNGASLASAPQGL